MSDPRTKTSNEKLSTPVYKHLNGVHSWDTASKEARTAFYRAMKGRAYGFEPTLDAWNWFMAGWSAIHPGDTHETCEPRGPSGHVGGCMCSPCREWRLVQYANAQKASERRGTPEEEADWAEFGDCPRCWRCAAPVITIPGCAPGCIRNCPPSPQNEGESR